MRENDEQLGLIHYYYYLTLGTLVGTEGDRPYLAGERELAVIDPNS